MKRILGQIESNESGLSKSGTTPVQFKSLHHEILQKQLKELKGNLVQRFDFIYAESDQEFKSIVQSKSPHHLRKQPGKSQMPNIYLVEMIRYASR